MSLDQMVRGEAPALCLPHQCEFLSDTWLDRATAFLESAVQRSDALPAFCLFETFDNAPPHLGLPDNIAAWCVHYDGNRLTIGRDCPHTPDVQVSGEYQAGLQMAQVVGGLSSAAMDRAFREVRHWFGKDAIRMTGQFADPGVADLLALMHDHLARMTVENPDIAHRAAALGIERHIADVEANGYTVIENAISPAFADEVRAATLRALLPHHHHQLQWMLYHGQEFEQLVQNPPLMTLMDSTLGRGAVIASIS